MIRGFSFDGALMFPFRAAHVQSFPWKFALALAVVCTVLTGLLLFLARDAFFSLFDTLERLTGSTEGDLDLLYGILGGFFGRLAPLILLGVLASLVVWAMFMAATQRRYLFDEDFSLRFGPDELRLMGAGSIWYAVQSLVGIVPLLLVLPVFTAIGGLESGDLSEDEFVRLFFARFGLVLLAMLVIMPFYIFFATRFSPVFAMTVKEGRIAFGDAWIVSRGRFWPMFGAFLILAIVGGMAVGAVSSIAQMVLMPAFMSSPAVVDDVPDLRALLTPAVIAGMLFYMFVRFFMSGLLMHVVQGPAAFAARHDPRGSVDDVRNIQAFD